MVIFNNLLPNIKKTSTGLYELNGGKSYDRDKNQGGAVKLYKWNINGTEIKWKKPVLKQHLKKGFYTIKLTVYDGANSATVSRIFKIE